MYHLKLFRMLNEHLMLMTQLFRVNKGQLHPLRLKVHLPLNHDRSY